MARVLGKSSRPQLMSFYQSMLFLPRLALTCVPWSTGKSQCGLFGGPSPSLSAQENPISLDGAWKPLPPVSLPSAAWPGTLQNKEEPYREVLSYVMGWGWGTVSSADERPRQEKKRPKKYMSLCISPRMAAYDCGVGTNDTKFQPPAVSFPGFEST